MSDNLKDKHSFPPSGKEAADRRDLFYREIRRADKKMTKFRVEEKENERRALRELLQPKYG